MLNSKAFIHFTGIRIRFHNQTSCIITAFSPTILENTADSLVRVKKALMFKITPFQ